MIGKLKFLMTAVAIENGGNAQNLQMTTEQSPQRDNNDEDNDQPGFVIRQDPSKEECRYCFCKPCITDDQTDKCGGMVIMDENKSPLCDITNVPKSKVSCRKRLVDGTPKNYRYERKIRKTIEFYFDTTDKKLEFEKKFESAKKLLHLKTNTELFNRLIELLDLNQKPSMSTEISDKSVNKNEILSDDSITF
ncbi:unnamed protein product [Mytilus edulis]|uniref:Uncharacterized protein n=1 Tax=Mytilus edulis TaxID=6550 RepID=A0A8S3R7R7_MYTED|nr:unnamed protein product [Mytilus edulis]